MTNMLAYIGISTAFQELNHYWSGASLFAPTTNKSLGGHYVGWVFSGGSPREWEGLLLLRSTVNFSSGS